MATDIRVKDDYINVLDLEAGTIVSINRNALDRMYTIINGKLVKVDISRLKQEEKRRETAAKKVQSQMMSELQKAKEHMDRTVTYVSSDEFPEKTDSVGIRESTKE